MADVVVKRSACNRCRRQKLRCVRPGPDQSCERCRKFHTNCCTSDSASRLGSSISRNSGSLPTSQLSRYASSADSEPSLRLGPVASVNIFQDGIDPLAPENGNMIGPDLDMTFQAQLQNFDGFSNNQNTLQTELWEELGQSGLTQTLPTIGCFDNNFLDKLFQTPTIPSCADESSRPMPSAQSPTKITKAVQTGYEILGHTAVLSNVPQHQRAIEASPVHSGQMSSELANPHTKSVFSEDIKLYTTQIRDLHRRSTRDADEYMATRHSSPDMAVNMKTHSMEPRAAASRHFITTLFGDSQTFLTILRHIQACVRTSATHTDPRNPRRPKFRADDSLVPRLGGPNAIECEESSSRPSFSDNIIGPHALDFQSSLTIISYYAHLIHAYDTAFQDILIFMGDAALGNLPAILSLYIPEIEIGSIRLIDQPRLQLESLLKASSVILESIDNSLGLGATASANGSSSGAQPQGLLLDALLCQSDLVYQKADGTREARVKQTISQIHQFLDSARK